MTETDIATQAVDTVGVNQATVLAIIGIVLAGILVRFLTMAFAPSLLKKIIRSKNLQHKTCLLYTSPSPRDRSLSRMPSSA